MFNQKTVPARVWLWLLLALTLAVYWPGMSGDFLFDDSANILENERLKFDTLDWQTLWLVIESGDAGTLKRLVSMTSFALNVAATGFNPFYFKLTNLVIHLLNVVLVYLLGRQWQRAGSGRTEPPDGAFVPLMAAALWALHPLNLTGVLYIVQRMTSLAALFSLLAILCYSVGRNRQIRGEGGAWRLILAGTAIPGLLALFSKESGVLLPIYLLAVEALLFRFEAARAEDRRRVVWFHQAIMGLVLAATVMVFAFRPDVLLGSYAVREFTLEERLLTQARVIFFYIRLFLAPVNGALSLFHDDFATSTSLLSPPETAFAVAGVGGLLALIIFGARRAPVLVFALCWFLGGHLLESTFLPLEMVHEHRNYLPIVGPCYALAFYADRDPKARRFTRGALALFLLLLALLTWNRASHWSSLKDHAIYEVTNRPESERAHIQVARALTLLYVSEHNPAFLEEALHQFSEAARLSPVHISGEAGVIRVSFLGQKRPDPAVYQSIIDKVGHGPQPPVVGVVLQDIADCNIYKICDVPDEVMMSIFTSFQNNPNAVISAKSAVSMIMAQYLVDKMGDLGTAIIVLENSVARHPAYLNGARNLVRLYRLSGQFDKAWKALAAVRERDRFGELKPELDREEAALKKAEAEKKGEKP